jgi:hypothetical protein
MKFRYRLAIQIDPIRLEGVYSFWVRIETCREYEIIYHLLATSDGDAVDDPQWYRGPQSKLRIIQCTVSRRTMRIAVSLSLPFNASMKLYPIVARIF